MKNIDDFKQQVQAGYSVKGPSVILGPALFDGQVVKDTLVKLPLKTLNRHGLIAGATGTGKTVTLQLIAESLCAEGVPVLLMDMKGDLGGIARPGAKTPIVEERSADTGLPFEPSATAVELLTLSAAPGVRLRATVSEFGPVLFSKMLELNDTQSGIVAMLFKYADDHQLPLLDLKDFRQLLQFSTTQGKAELQAQYGNISPASVSTILRRIIELETQGATLFFGEKSFEVTDLVRTDAEGRGIASVIRLADIQDKPKLFSTFMLCLLAEVFSAFPEAGDLEKPKLCIFIDEAHLIFKEASKALLDQLESMIKLIRSKGVGIFFITQNPQDIPDAILSQLGLKVQHALRAFTEKDRKAIKRTAENYPLSEFYKTDSLLTSLGIGQALVTALSEKGTPTPLAAVHLKMPASHVGPLSPSEITEVLASSGLIEKYNENIDRESAYEILLKKISGGEEAVEKSKSKRAPAAEKSILEKASENTMVRQAGRAIAKELTRGLLGVLGLGGGGSRKKGWF
jgi:DNA helicase HerA-like ATPase